MAHPYELVVLERRAHHYSEYRSEAGSFAEAFHAYLMANRRLLGESLIVYCRRPQSGDLKLMATYLGGSSYSGDGVPIRHILRLSDGREMHLEETGFALNV